MQRYVPRVPVARFLMLAVTFFWGMSYLLMKVALVAMGPMTLLAWRFAIAFLIMFALFPKVVLKASRAAFKRGIIMGIVLFGVFLGMITGTDYTTASNAAFFSSTAVVIVPVLESILRRTAPTWVTIVSVLLAVLGIYLLTASGSGLVFDAGMAWCLLGAFMYALYIVVQGFFADKKDSAEGSTRNADDTFAATIIQLPVAAILGAIAMLLVEEPAAPQTLGQWAAVLVLAAACSAFGFVVQPVAQRTISSVETGLIYSFEPVFTALLSFIFLSEVLTGVEYLGMALIFLAAILDPVVVALSSRFAPAGAADAS